MEQPPRRQRGMSKRPLTSYEESPLQTLLLSRTSENTDGVTGIKDGSQPNPWLDPLGDGAPDCLNIPINSCHYCRQMS
jgi:hypothetical protein